MGECVSVVDRVAGHEGACQNARLSECMRTRL